VRKKLRAHGERAESTGGGQVVNPGPRVPSEFGWSIMLGARPLGGKNAVAPLEGCWMQVLALPEATVVQARPTTSRPTTAL
jgi:hypothetical protein